MYFIRRATYYSDKFLYDKQKIGYTCALANRTADFWNRICSATTILNWTLTIDKIKNKFHHLTSISAIQTFISFSSVPQQPGAKVPITNCWIHYASPTTVNWPPWSMKRCNPAATQPAKVRWHYCSRTTKRPSYTLYTIWKYSVAVAARVTVLTNFDLIQIKSKSTIATVTSMNHYPTAHTHTHNSQSFVYSLSLSLCVCVRVFVLSRHWIIPGIRRYLFSPSPHHHHHQHHLHCHNPSHWKPTEILRLTTKRFGQKYFHFRTIQQLGPWSLLTYFCCRCRQNHKAKYHFGETIFDVVIWSSTVRNKNNASHLFLSCFVNLFVRRWLGSWEV